MKRGKEETPLAMAIAIAMGKPKSRVQSQDEVVDEGSVENYANYVLQGYNSHSGDSFELVKTGPLAVGDFFGSSIFHFNFEAKNTADPNAEVQTFFTELTKTNMDMDVSSVRCLGPTKALPEIADDRGCVYCRSHNIHHPEWISSFRNGRADHLIFLYRQVDKLHKFFSNSLKNSKVFSPLLVHPELHGKELSRLLVHPVRHYFFIKHITDSNSDLRRAHEAISLYNGKQGKNMEVTDMGIVSAVVLRNGCLCHLNFKAKNKDESNAPEQTFFAEMIRGNNFLFVDCCECLGPSDSLPDKANLRGCTYCKLKKNMHHPRSLGYSTGGELLLGDRNKT